MKPLLWKYTIPKLQDGCRKADNELLNLFNKTQLLPDDQKKTVMDLLSAFLLKANLTKQLT